MKMINVFLMKLQVCPTATYLVRQWIGHLTNPHKQAKIVKSPNYNNNNKKIPFR